MEIKSEKELQKKLDALGLDDDEQIKRVVCSLIGHSNIQTMCFGYVYCSRCDAQVGDTLGSFYENEKQVVVGHNCDICHKNYKKLSWKDKFMAPNPFKKEIMD